MICYLFPKRYHLIPRILPLTIILLLVLSGMRKPPKSTLSENIRITSQNLGYDLQYRVYMPPGYETVDNLPVIYITDGQGYIATGNMPAVMDSLIETSTIAPALAVFVDARNPNNLQQNRRNQQFFCNQQYADFFSEELIPHIDAIYNTRADRSARVILGLSFGGLNAACFGLQAHEAFEGIAIQSPAMHPVPTLFEAYRNRQGPPLNIFLSSGTFNDNEQRTRAFRDLLQDTGHALHYVEVPFAHNWNNWGPLLDDVLKYYWGE